MNTIKNIILTLIFSIFAINCFSQNSKNNEGKFIDNLLNRMSIDEKIGQLNQVNFDRPLDSIIVSIRKGEIGSILNADAKVINRLQEAALKESPSGIPLIIGRDIIHGYKTIFPIPLGQASSFNPQVVEDGARVAATESREQGITWTFAPMLDISRDARWGRIAESLGEDPYLTGELGAAMVRGFQSNDLSSSTSIASCIKHFVGYGASEGGRDYNSTTVPIHLMHNVYLPPFEKTISAGAASLMTSFNENDGIPASGDDYLLKTILRDKWNFNGFVVSDWNSMGEMINHGFAKDRKHVAEISLKAGIDMEMVSKTYFDYLKQLTNEGKISVKDIDNAVRNILRIKYRLGLFENPYIDMSQSSTAYTPEHLSKARRAAVQSAILLKNKNNILPIKQSQKIAIIGPMANAPHDQLGTWSFDGDKTHTITPLKALETEYNYIDYKYEAGLSYSRDKDTTNFKKVRDVVSQSDIAIVFVGEEAILSGEAHCLSNINLIGVQSALLKTVKSVGKPVVMVVMAGRPLTIERDLPNADAILYNFHPGTMGGPAILDLLFGKENPSGKLPVTFVREVGQIPMYYNHNNTGRPVTNIVHVDDIPLEASQTSLGNTSFYLDSGDKPLFPFGYGLSYSKFEYSNLKLSKNEITTNDSIVIKATLNNVSDVAGTEVVQLYIRDLLGSIVRPVKELKGFQRIRLNAGESKVVEFTLHASDLAFYGRDLIKKIEAGEFEVWVATNSNEGLKASFIIK